MGIEGIENLQDGSEEIVSPDTEIQVQHATDEHGVPDEAVTQGETAEENAEAESTEEPQGTPITEDPGSAPDEAEQNDDGRNFDEPLPANPNVSEETPNA